MTLYNNSNQSSELKIHTYAFQQTNSFYPSPHSPSEDDTYTKQVPQEMIQKDNKEWMMAASHFDPSFYEHNQFNQHFESPESSVSCSSSLGMRTPDLGLFDMSNTFVLSHRPSFEYASLLHQSPILSCSPTLSLSMDDHALSLIDDPRYPDTVHRHYSSPSLCFPSRTMNDEDELIPSLSNEERMILQQQQKDHSDSSESFSAESYSDYTSSLSQLTKEQLIERVVRLEMEKSCRSTEELSGSKPIHSKFNNSSRVLIAKPTITESKESLNQMHSCKWVSCDAQAPTLDKLMTHICNTHIGSGKATYHCEWQDCSRDKKPFMKRHKMHNHMRTHTGERPFICAVIGCNKTFSRPDSLSTHIKTHSDNRPYLCSTPDCGKAYYHSRSLRKHIKSSHMKHSKIITIQKNLSSPPFSSRNTTQSHHLQNRINIIKKRQSVDQK